MQLRDAAQRRLDAALKSYADMRRMASQFPVSIKPMLKAKAPLAGSGFPDPAERRRCREYFATSASPKEALRDILWALLNSQEVVINHLNSSIDRHAFAPTPYNSRTKARATMNAVPPVKHAIDRV